MEDISFDAATKNLSGIPGPSQLRTCFARGARDRSHRDSRRGREEGLTPPFVLATSHLDGDKVELRALLVEAGKHPPPSRPTQGAAVNPYNRRV